jgi:hypothetical protein
MSVACPVTDKSRTFVVSGLAGSSALPVRYFSSANKQPPANLPTHQQPFGAFLARFASPEFEDKKPAMDQRGFCR